MNEINKDYWLIIGYRWEKNLIYANQKILKNRVKIISDAKVSCIMISVSVSNRVKKSQNLANLLMNEIVQDYRWGKKTWFMLARSFWKIVSRS